MRFFSVNKFVDELKTMFVGMSKIDMLLNLKLFTEDKFKNMVGPILLLKIHFQNGNDQKLTYTQITERFGEDVRIKMLFPSENKSQYLICSVDADETISSVGSFHKRLFSKVGYATQKHAQSLTQTYEKTKERIGEAMELFDGGEDL
jgi:hypothetical protein